MSEDGATAGATSGPPHRRAVVISALGICQILAWGSSYYLIAVLAEPIARDTGWSLGTVVGGVSVGLLVAGLASPRVGGLIELYGGRRILAASAVLLAAGLGTLAVAQDLATYGAAWLLLGLGMGCGLYDPAFATLGRLYGLDARRAITTLTLFGGFASTVCWPLSALLVETLGWRGACLAYAAIHLCVTLPAYLFLLPREAQRPRIARAKPGQHSGGSSPPLPRRRALVVLVGAALMLSAVLSTVMSVHLLTILQARGVSLNEAVALGAVVGPSQVGARFLEMLIAHRHHPIWTKAASAGLVAAGVIALWAGLPVIAVALILYGAGIGLESIARGTLPLALFGAEGYAALMGKLALPSLLAQAAAPSAGALLLSHAGASGALLAIVAVALCNVLLVAVLVRAVRRRG